MKRRSFIKRTAPLAVLPVVINGMSFKSYAKSPLLKLLASKATAEDKVFVIIQLNGGNDGLNTLIPLDQYSNLSNARSNILIPSSKVLNLNGTTATGLHPSMTGLQELYNNGKLNILQSIGYPSPNFSHFRATDIWLSSSDSNQYISSGWVGRFLENEYPDFPTGFPNGDMPDPLAIQVGSVVSPAMQGSEVNMGMAIADPSTFYNFTTGNQDPVPNTPAGKELAYLRLAMEQSNQYATRVKNAYNGSTTKSTKYASTGNNLSDQMKIVARLISGGLKTKIYMVSIGGFDTHSQQVANTGGTETGAHADLLSKLSVAISAFQDDIEKMGLADKVAGMTFSEFGRRVASNASMGTDHGAAAPCFVFGKGVNNSIIGTNPVIPATVSAADNVNMQYDFRQIYASVLLDWFGLSATETNQIMLKEFNTLPIFKKTVKTSKISALVTEVKNYPNPFVDYTTLQFSTNGGFISIKIYDTLGNEIDTVLNKNLVSGNHQIKIDTSKYEKGNYYYTILSGDTRQVGHMLKI